MILPTALLQRVRNDFKMGKCAHGNVREYVIFGNAATISAALHHQTIVYFTARTDSCHSRVFFCARVHCPQWRKTKLTPSRIALKPTEMHHRYHGSSEMVIQLRKPHSSTFCLWSSRPFVTYSPQQWARDDYKLSDLFYARLVREEYKLFYLGPGTTNLKNRNMVVRDDSKMLKSIIRCSESRMNISPHNVRQATEVRRKSLRESTLLQSVEQYHFVVMRQSLILCYKASWVAG